MVAKCLLPRPQSFSIPTGPFRTLPFASYQTTPNPPTCLSRCAFSTTTPVRRRPDRFRGVSALRKTGPRQRLSVHKYDLPKPTPVKDRPQVETAEDHGLWAFFNNKSPLMTPLELSQHGRAWTFQELRRKGWEDLHALWWVCMKQTNVVKTAEHERQRVRAGFGAYEARERLDQIRITQKRILAVLTERWYQWEDAYEMAKSDPTIDLSGQGPVYQAGFEDNETPTADEAPKRPILTPQFNVPRSEPRPQP